MINIALCDDDKKVLKDLSTFVIIVMEKMNLEYKLHCFSNEKELINMFHTDIHIDILFLDIQLNVLTGVQVGNYIRKNLKQNNTKIIYISTSSDYAMSIIKTQPYDYIIKPLTLDKIEPVLTRLIDGIIIEQGIFKYKIQKTEKIVFLKNILYFENIGKKIKIITNDSCDSFYGKLADIDDMKLHNFLLVHRAFLVNLSYISQYNYSSVTLTNGDVISIGSNRRSEVKDAIHNYFKERTTNYISL